jgi:aminopeptidase YwaD
MLTMPLKTMLSIIAIVLTLSASNHFHHKNPARIKAPYKTTIGVQEFYTQLADAVSNDNIVDILTYLESQGVRNSNGADNNASLNVVRDWLVTKLASYGYAVQLHDAGIFGDNIVIEKTGTEFPDNKIVVGGHYDSVAAGPGINDNGSGIAALLEIARILSDFNTKKSLIIIFFTGEEDGFQGSRIWAQEASANNMQIDLMFNLDMFGGISNRNGEPYTMTSITCERDEGNSTPTNDAASWAVTDTLAMFTNTYTSIDAVIDYAYSSDYMVFEQEGYVITGYYEYVPEGNPYYHRATDILSNMDVDYLYQAVRGAVTFTAHMAKAKSDSHTSITDSEFNNQVNGFILHKMFPNPFNPSLKIQYNLLTSGFLEIRVFDIKGRLLKVLEHKYVSNGNYENIWNGAQFASGTYVFQFIFNGQIVANEKALLLK